MRPARHVHSGHPSDRRRERPLASIGDAAEILAELLGDSGGRRYALFGHSMGALVAYWAAA